MLQILRDYGKSITEYKDQNGFTLLHHAVLSMKDGKVKTLIEFAKNENNASAKELMVWINA